MSPATVNATVRQQSPTVRDSTPTLDFGIGTLTFLDGLFATDGRDIEIKLSLHRMTMEDVVLVCTVIIPFCFVLGELFSQLQTKWAGMNDAYDSRASRRYSEENDDDDSFRNTNVVGRALRKAYEQVHPYFYAL